MGKGKSIKIEPTGDESQKLIEQITWEIWEVKEQGLRVKMSTTVYNVAKRRLDKDLGSKMKKNKYIEIEREEMGKKLDMLWQKIQEI